MWNFFKQGLAGGFGANLGWHAGNFVIRWVRRLVLLFVVGGGATYWLNSIDPNSLLDKKPVQQQTAKHQNQTTSKDTK
jgi:hypothetical protein